MIPGALDDITAQDLQRFVDQGLGEGRQLEFKGFLGSLPKRDRVLKTVCAFANTDGGDLVLGIKESNGFADTFAPIPREILDTEKLRVEGWIETGIDPPVVTCRMREVEVKDGFTIVVRVERSWAGPHRVVYGGGFWGRNSGANYELPMDQVRQAFTEVSLLAERIRDFRTERVEHLVSGKSPMGLFGGPMVMLHLVPPGGIVRGDQIDVQLAYQQIIREDDIGLGYGLPVRDFNFEGVLGSIVADDGTCLAYVQVFRNGTLEAVRELPAKPPILKPNAGGEVAPVDRYIAPYLEQLLGFLGKLSVEPPLIALVTATGVISRQLWIEDDPYTGHRTRKILIDRDTLLLPEVEIPSFEPSPERNLRPAFDVFWNAFGHSKSQLFNAAGEYTGTGKHG